MTPRVVVDTSALVPPTVRRELQELAAVGSFTALWSPWIIAELNRVLTWQWIAQPYDLQTPCDVSIQNWRRCRQSAHRMMTILLPTFELVHPLPPFPPAWESFSDPDDHPIWAAAVVGRAEYVISENSRHYPPRQPDGRHLHQGIEYLPARAFLDRLIAGEA
jgi:hypothetical protein